MDTSRKRFIIRLGEIAAILVFVFPPCREYADYYVFCPRWMFAADLFRPGSLWYPDWLWIVAELAVVVIATALCVLWARRSTGWLADGL